MYVLMSLSLLILASPVKIAAHYLNKRVLMSLSLLFLASLLLFQ